MNFIASELLTQIESEEDAFWGLVFVMMDRGWRDIFLPKSNKIKKLLKKLEVHIKRNLPRLYEHFV